MTEKIRKNPLCVISVEAYGDNAVHDIQTNTSWADNPYTDYAIVPDEMVPDILATKGYCDIVLNTKGTEVVSFTAREIPEDIVVEPLGEEPTADEILNVLLGVE